MGQATSQIEAHIQETRADPGSDLNELQQRLSLSPMGSSLSKRTQMTMLGVAFGRGILLATMLDGRKGRRGTEGFFEPSRRLGTAHRNRPSKTQSSGNLGQHQMRPYRRRRDAL